jgi:dTDP-4-dehydrorhamnose reductase
MRETIQGIAHFSGKVAYTKFQMALLIASLFHLPSDHIERDRGQANVSNVQRPDNAALNIDQLENEWNIRVEQADFATTIRRCLETFL